MCVQQRNIPPDLIAQLLNCSMLDSFWGYGPVMFPDRNSTETFAVMIGNMTLNATANYTCYDLDENSFSSTLFFSSISI